MIEYLFIAAGASMEIAGIDQAARAKEIKQREIARQARDNALAIQAQAERDATLRSQKYSEFLRDSSAIRGYNRRGADRSFKAIQEKARRQTVDELRTAQIQSLFARGRSEQRARFAEFEGVQARTLAELESMTALTSAGYDAYNVK